MRILAGLFTFSLLLFMSVLAFNWEADKEPFPGPHSITTEKKIDSLAETTAEQHRDAFNLSGEEGGKR